METRQLQFCIETGTPPLAARLFPREPRVIYKMNKPSSLKVGGMAGEESSEFRTWAGQVTLCGGRSGEMDRWLVGAEGPEGSRNDVRVWVVVAPND